MPSGRCLPLALGIYTLRTGRGCQDATAWCTRTATAILDRDNSAESRDLAAVMSSSGYFKTVARIDSYDEALALLDTLQARARERYVPSYWLAFVYVGLGDNDQAVEWMSKAFQEHSAWLAWANVEPRFDSLRRDPRFQAILRQVGFSGSV
jgi:tetratricopeptide (TPR) repeat protein